MLHGRKKILFPATDRVHLARQSLLLDKLSEKYEVIISKYYKGNKMMSKEALKVFSFFDKELRKKEPDLLLARGDRFEVLPIVVAAAYQGIPIAHIEGGAETGSGVIDSKVRHAISQLADYHFVTDYYAQKKLIFLGADPDYVFNVGSLDVSFAKLIEPKRIVEEDYILFLQHSIPGESNVVVHKVIEDLGVKVIGIKANSDYEKSITSEEYTPEEFISIMYFAKCAVGNSSAMCKEASILGTPCVLVGRRQDGRLVGHNVMRVPHEPEEIEKATKYQMEHGRYKADMVYYKENTEQMIADKIDSILYERN